MQNQTKPKPLGAPMVKLVLVVIIILCLGVAGYLVLNKSQINLPAIITPTPTYEQCLKLESKISKDINSLDSSCEIDSDCKTLIFSGNWRNICVNRDTDTTKVQSAAKSFPKKCPFPGVWPPIECSCVENKCAAIIEKREEADETADLSFKALATEDWKTYRNEEYGFEVKYPGDWLKNEVDLFPDYMKEAVISSSSHTFFIPQVKRIPEDVWVSISTSPCETSSCDPREEIEEPYRKTIKQSTIKGQSIFVFNNPFEGERDLNYIIVNNEKTQQAWLTLAIHHGRQNGMEYLSDEEIQPELETFNQILSTFKFIE